MMFTKKTFVLPAVVAGLVAARTSSCVDNTICLDAVNSCGTKWGGCYNTCEPENSPTPVPCGDDPTDTPAPTITDGPTLVPEPTEDPDETCSDRMVCADYINECGMMYGGCFPDCKPWPTFEAPPCPTPAPTEVASPGCEDGEEHSICVDYVNDCGMMYGGCFDYCSTPYPSFTTPSCPSSTLETRVRGPGHGDRPMRGGRRTRTGRPRYTATATPDDDGDHDEPDLEEICETQESLIICVDGIDDCGNGWGDCYDACLTPSHPGPAPCTVTPTPAATLKPGIIDDCSAITICKDYINDCGRMYGGCHNMCSPTPTYTAPPCPEETKTAY